MKNIILIALSAFIFFGCAVSQKADSLYQENKVKIKNTVIDKSIDLGADKVKENVK